MAKIILLEGIPPKVYGSIIPSAVDLVRLKNEPNKILARNLEILAVNYGCFRQEKSKMTATNATGTIKRYRTFPNKN